MGTRTRHGQASVTCRYPITVLGWHMMNIGTAFVLLGLDILVSASSCLQNMNGCMRILEVPTGGEDQFPRCREVAKFLNCIQVHCVDSFSPCEMDVARQTMLAKFDDTGIECDSRKLLSPAGDCSSPKAGLEQPDAHASAANSAKTYPVITLGSAPRNFFLLLCKFWSLMNWFFVILIGSLFICC